MRLIYLGYDETTQTARLVLERENRTDRVAEFIAYLTKDKPLGEDGPWDIVLTGKKDKIFSLLQSEGFKHAFIHFFSNSKTDATANYAAFIKTLPKTTSHLDAKITAVKTRDVSPSESKTKATPRVAPKQQEHKTIVNTLTCLQSLKQLGQLKAAAPRVATVASFDDWDDAFEILSEDARRAADSNNFIATKQYFEVVLQWLKNAVNTESAANLNLIAIDLRYFFEYIKASPVHSQHDELFNMLPEKLQKLVTEETPAPTTVVSRPVL